MADSSTAIWVRKLSKDFAGIEVLRDIDLDIAAGTSTCILGPSGSGKSTFLRCLNWLEDPRSGSILLDGRPFGRLGTGPDAKPMKRRELAAMRTGISMVFQHFALWPHQTVLGNVMEAPVQVLGRPRREVEAEVRRILERVGLGHKIDVYPHTLYGGQKQRVAISRALAMKPRVSLFDEPTSALDPEMVGEVLNVIKELAKEGMTMVIVTHDMGFARDVAETIVFMDGGRIQEVAPRDEFFERPKSGRARRFIVRD